MKKPIIAVFRFYKKFISPLLPGKCIYTPTCSEYGIEAVKKHGAVIGVYLTVRRIIRCNPFRKGGLDPVPDKKSVYKWLV
ncbi:MAG: membrane protein insertion efficiency factor YidD [Clostridia bacterium]|nr:membrane protein insertion efficiency factor YidD [Clostridia bacterium]